MNKLHDIVPQGTKENPIMTSKSTVYDRELEIQSVTFQEGDNGEYARFIFNFSGETELHALLTGSTFILPKLHAIQAANAFPVSATMKKIGSADTLE